MVKGFWTQIAQVLFVGASIPAAMLTLPTESQTWGVLAWWGGTLGLLVAAPFLDRWITEPEKRSRAGIDQSSTFQLNVEE